MRTTRSRIATIALAVSILAGVAACSSDDGDGGADKASAGGSSASSDGSTTTTTSPDGSAAPAGKVATGEATPSAGCGTSTAAPVEKKTVKLAVSGKDRSYDLVIPKAHDGKTPLPVVVDFHGLAEGAVVHAEMTQMGPLGEKEGFVAVFPQGLGTPVKWSLGEADDPNSDVPYVDAMLDDIEKALCVDTSRVYSTGLSFGAIMSSFIACGTLGERFAAVAPVSGITHSDSCDPRHPMPVLTFHGTADPILLFNGGVNLSGIPSGAGGTGGAAASTTTTTQPVDLDGAGYPAAVAAWAKQNGCEPEPEDTKVSDDVIHRVYDCPPQSPVEFYIVLGGGHSWPGSEFSKSIGKIVGPTTFDIDATELIWAFFQRFRLPD